MKKNLIRWILPLVVLFNAWNKDDATPGNATPPDITDTTSKGGEYVLSEGGFNQNNSKLAFRADSSGVITGDYFLQQNPSLSGGLGDLANDAIIYGSKLYIVVNNSGNVTVLDAKTGHYISTISFM